MFIKLRVTTPNGIFSLPKLRQLEEEIKSAQRERKREKEKRNFNSAEAAIFVSVALRVLLLWFWFFAAERKKRKRKRKKRSKQLIKDSCSSHFFRYFVATENPTKKR